MFFHQFPSTNHKCWWKNWQNHQKTLLAKKVDFNNSKEMLLFCWLKKWYLEGFYSFAEDEKVVLGEIRTRSLQKQPFDHQQMITDHPNFNLTTDKKICFSIIFSTFLKSTFLLIYQPFFQNNHPNNSFLIKFWWFHEAWHHY